MSTIPEAVAEGIRKATTRLSRFDPIEQISLANEVNSVLLAAQADMAEARRMAVRDLLMSGWTLKAIGDATGISHQRVSQIAMGADRKEKAPK